MGSQLFHAMNIPELTSLSKYWDVRIYTWLLDWPTSMPCFGIHGDSCCKSLVDFTACPTHAQLPRLLWPGVVLRLPSAFAAFVASSPAVTGDEIASNQQSSVESKRRVSLLVLLFVYFFSWSGLIDINLSVPGFIHVVLKYVNMLVIWSGCSSMCLWKTCHDTWPPCEDPTNVDQNKQRKVQRRWVPNKGRTYLRFQHGRNSWSWQSRVALEFGAEPNQSEVDDIKRSNQ